MIDCLTIPFGFESYWIARYRINNSCNVRLLSVWSAIAITVAIARIVTSYFTGVDWWWFTKAVCIAVDDIFEIVGSTIVVLIVIVRVKDCFGDIVDASGEGGGEKWFILPRD